MVDDFDLASDLHQPDILLTCVFLAWRQGEERLRPLLRELLLIYVMADARKEELQRLCTLFLLLDECLYKQYLHKLSFKLCFVCHELVRLVGNLFLRRF